MRDMKDSGISWIGKIPANWEITKFKYETAGYKAGPFGSALITEKLEDEGSILVYTPENVALMSDETAKDQYLPENRKYSLTLFRPCIIIHRLTTEYAVFLSNTEMSRSW